MSGIGKVTRLDDLDISDLTGAVVGLQGWVETTTTATTTTSGPWNQTSTNLSSESKHKMRLFIRDDGGREHTEQVSDPGIGICEGHKVSVLYVSAKSASQHVIGGLVNHNTGEVKTWRRQIERLVYLVNPTTGCLWLLAVPIAAWTLVFSLGPSWDLDKDMPFPMIAAIVALAIVLYRLNARRRKAVALCLGIEARVKDAATRLTVKR